MNSLWEISPHCLLLLSVHFVQIQNVLYQYVRHAKFIEQRNNHLEWLRRNQLLKKKVFCPQISMSPVIFLSVDKLTIKTNSRSSTVYGQEGPYSNFHECAIYNYSTSELIWIENQVCLGAGETIMGNINFE